MFTTLQLHATLATTLLLAFAAQAVPSVHRLEARAATLPTGWTDVGCVKDYPDRILKGYMFSSSSMTPVLCANTCRSRNFVSVAPLPLLSETLRLIISLVLERVGMVRHSIR